MNNGGNILLFGIIAIVIANAFKRAGENFRDQFASVLPGFLGVRSVKASEAATWVKNCMWLQNDYRDFLLKKFYGSSAYRLDMMGTNSAYDVAENIIEANVVIFGEGVADRIVNLGLSAIGKGDRPEYVVEAIRRVKNQVQALEVVGFYYTLTYRISGQGKNLSAGLQWLPDQYIIEVYEHLKSLPTGVFSSDGRQMSNLPKP